MLITSAGYLGDFAAGETVYIPFDTYSFSTGAPTALTTGGITVLRDDNTAITADVTLTANRSSVTGNNLVTIVTSGEEGFDEGHDFDVYLSAGTVGGVSVVGRIVGKFSIANRAAPTLTQIGTSGAAITVNSPVLENGTIEIIQGGDYVSTRSIVLTVTGYTGPSLTSGTAYFKAMPTNEYNAGTGTADISKTGTVSVSGTTVTLTYTLNAADTDDFDIVPETDGTLNYTYEAWVVTTGSKVIPLALGAMTIKRSVD